MKIALFFIFTVVNKNNQTYISLVLKILIKLLEKLNKNDWKIDCYVILFL